MIVVLDFETAYGKHPVTGENVSLQRLTTEEYVRHPEFKVHGCAIKIGDQPTFYARGGIELSKAFASIRWDEVAVCAHHAHFDMAILNWHYDIRPKFILDTLAMSRARFPHILNNLDNMASVLGIGMKGSNLSNFKDKWDLTDDEHFELAEYAKNDVDLEHLILHKLLPDYPQSELRIIDLTTRAFTEPELEIDIPRLQEYLDEQTKINDNVDAMLRLTLGDDSKVLRSTKKFAELLEKHGVTVPMKISGTTGRPIPALAKSDPQFIALRTHENPIVRKLVEARIGAKSSIAHTRAERFIEMGKRGTFPVYLQYYGARNTGRFSAGDKQNMQNLPRGSELRYSMCAPEGFTLIGCDLSNIEARMLAWLAGQLDLLTSYRTGGDPYCDFASVAFQREIVKNVDDFERHVGKVCILGLGYSMSWPKLAGVMLAGPLGKPPITFTEEMMESLHLSPSYLGMPISLVRDKVPSALPDKELLAHATVCKYLVDTYRHKNRAITKYWRQADNMLMDMSAGIRRQYGPIYTEKDAIVFPNGLKLQYPNLRKRSDGWVYKGHKFDETYIYGAKLVENIVQGLSRIVMSDGMLRIANHYRVVMTVHDEVLSLIESLGEDYSKSVARWMERTMCIQPHWAPDLPLDAEAHWGKSYGDCK